MYRKESAEYEREQEAKKKGALVPPKEIMSLSKKNKYTPDELYTHAYTFFNKCDETVIGVDKNGRPIKKPKTRSWLCLYLGVGADYIAAKSRHPAFEEVISYIRQTTANDLEEGMLTGQYNATWAIFALKNHEGWSDRVQVDSVVDNNITIKFKE